MLNWLKWIIAGRELAELERWRVECGQAERWLSESDDARHALEYVRGMAEGVECKSVSWVRDRMRERRARPNMFAVAAVPYPARGDDEDWYRAPLISVRHPSEPTLYDVGVHAERGIDYRFLGVTGEESA